MASKQITISAPNMKVLELNIVGTATMCQHKFSTKALTGIKEKQEAGEKAKKGKKREAKDFQEYYLNSMHVSREGWNGIPASAFRCAMISACRIVGFQMTRAKLSIFIFADGYEEDGTPLVRITKGKPKYGEDAVRIPSTGAMDIRPRAKFDPGWEAKVRIKYDADQFSDEDIVNLMSRVGTQVGIGEGRPDSKNSAGMEWGTFDIVNKKR